MTLARGGGGYLQDECCVRGGYLQDDCGARGYLQDDCDARGGGGGYYWMTVARGGGVTYRMTVMRGGGGGLLTG